MLNVLTTPYRVIPGTLTDSIWVAINNEVCISCLRRDIDFSSVADDGSGNSIFTMSSGTLPPSMQIGGKVYFFDTTDFVYSGSYSVLAFTSTTVTLNFPYPGSTFAGGMNLTTDFSNYFARVFYEKSDDLGATFVRVSEGQYFCSPKGELLIDATPYLQPLVKLKGKNMPPLSTIKNDISDFMDQYCRLRIVEEFDSVDYGHLINDIESLPLIIVDNCIQIGRAPNAVNLVPYITDDVPSQLMKWLGVFKEPTLFRNFPFHLSFIFSELLTNVTLRNSIEEDLTLGGTNIYPLDIRNYGHVNRYFPQFLYDVAHDNTESVAITSLVQFAEVITLKVKSCTIENPVYLKWIDTTGHWNGWVFGVNQTESETVTTPEGSFAQFIEDLAAAQSTSIDISRSAVPEIMLGCDGLSSDDLRALSTIRHSPLVLMLINPETWQDPDFGEQYVVVKPNVGRDKTLDTRAARHQFEMIIQLPELIIQSN